MLRADPTFTFVDGQCVSVARDNIRRLTSNSQAATNSNHNQSPENQNQNNNANATNHNNINNASAAAANESHWDRWFRRKIEDDEEDPTERQTEKRFEQQRLF